MSHYDEVPSEDVSQDVLDAMSRDPQDQVHLRLEGEFAAWLSPWDANRLAGYSDWCAYLPSAHRAVAVSNGDPVWYDATDLADAVVSAQSEGYLVIRGDWDDACAWRRAEMDAPPEPK